MTTATLDSRPAGQVRVGLPALLTRSLAAEWTRLRSVRSTYGSVLVAIAATVGIAALVGWITTLDDQPDAAAVTALDLAGAGIAFGQFGLVALAALAITAEFATGSIRSTLAATPARWVVLTTKAVVVGVLTFIGGFAATALAILASAPILDVGTDGILADSARSAAALTLSGLVVLGLGAVLRSTAGTITTAVAILFAAPIVGAMVPNETVSDVLGYFPAGLSTVLAAGSGESYGPGLAALLLGAWAVAMLVVGAVVLHRRDP